MIKRCCAIFVSAMLLFGCALAEAMLSGYAVMRRTGDRSSMSDIPQLIDEAIAATGTTGMAGMGKVMGMLKGKLTGRADMGKVSALIKQKLTA